MIVFRDFVPGETYRQRVSMTNVSYGKCAFKIKHLDMDPAFAGFFEFEYDYPGRIPPGMSRGASYTLVPIRPRWRGERRYLRTLPVASLRPPLAFNTRPRRLSTPTDAFQLHPDFRL